MKRRTSRKCLTPSFVRENSEARTYTIDSIIAELQSFESENFLMLCNKNTISTIFDLSSIMNSINFETNKHIHYTVHYTDAKVEVGYIFYDFGSNI